jgi:hypothetical protein
MAAGAAAASVATHQIGIQLGFTLFFFAILSPPHPQGLVKLMPWDVKTQILFVTSGRSLHTALPWEYSAGHFYRLESRRLIGCGLFTQDADTGEWPFPLFFRSLSGTTIERWSSPPMAYCRAAEFPFKPRVWHCQAAAVGTLSC